jgi:two-component system, LytTR family, response regulator
MIKAVIIDDERNSRDIISLMLEKYCPDVQIAATASDCNDGIATIKAHTPQLVFLDLEMPDGTGFDVLLGAQHEKPFEVIFVTAFEKKFLHTIRFSEVEIILKPIDRESLMTAVSVVSSRIRANASKHRYKVLLNNFSNGRNQAADLVVPLANGRESVIVQLKNIAYLEAGIEHCTLYLSQGAPLYTERGFRYYTDLFGGLGFYQVNNVQMVQLKQISHIEMETGNVVLKNGSRLEVTERRKRDLMNQWRLAKSV